MDLFGRGDRDEDLSLARATSLSEQFGQQWKLRMMAQEAALSKAGNGRLRRLLARNRSFSCADIGTGAAVLFYKTVGRQSTPRWRGPAKIIHTDETGVATKFRSQALKRQGIE